MTNPEQLPPASPADHPPPPAEVVGGIVAGWDEPSWVVRPDGGREFNSCFDNGSPRAHVVIHPDGGSRLKTHWPNGQVFFDQTRKTDGSLDYRSYHECGCPWFDQVRDSGGNRTPRLHSLADGHSCDNQAGSG